MNGFYGIELSDDNSSSSKVNDHKMCLYFILFNVRPINVQRQMKKYTFDKLNSKICIKINKNPVFEIKS